jgi:hypothetical protein
MCASRKVPCHTRDTISKTHPIGHDMQGLSPCCLAWGVSTCTPFHHPVERRSFCLSSWDQERAFARAVMRAVPKMRLIGRVFNGPSGKRVPRPSAPCASCMPWVPRPQFDSVNQDRRRRREVNRADRSGRSFQMNGPKILYLLRVTIESQSCGGALAIIADPWMLCDDIASGGEYA